MSYFCRLTILLVGLCAVNSINVNKIKDLPARFPRCPRRDPKLNECLLNATEQVRPFLIEGVKEINFPPIEPLLIPSISLEQGTSALNFHATLNNVSVYGLKNYKFSRFDFNVKNLEWFCKAVIAPLTLEGNYTVVGKILLAPIEGSGKFTAGIDRCDVDVYQRVVEATRNGEVYLKPVVTNSTIKVGGPKAHLEGLFNGNDELNTITNKVINDNVNELFEDLKPVIEQIITNIMEDLLFKTLEDNIPFSKLYPDHS